MRSAVAWTTHPLFAETNLGWNFVLIDSWLLFLVWSVFGPSAGSWLAFHLETGSMFEDDSLDEKD